MRTKLKTGGLHGRSATNSRDWGLLIAEAAASLVVLLPITILLLFTVCEVSYCFMVKTCLSDAARFAARDLAIAYGGATTSPPAIMSDPSPVLNQIRIPNVVVSNDQFNVTWNTSEGVETVHVIVTYKGGAYTLPLLPVPDPLHLGNTHEITSDATYRVE